MDQATTDMQTEAQEPQYNKNYEDCPKHIRLFRAAGARELQFLSGGPQAFIIGC